MGQRFDELVAGMVAGSPSSVEHRPVSGGLVRGADTAHDAAGSAEVLARRGPAVTALQHPERCRSFS